MKFSEFVSSVYNHLRESDARKPVTIPKSQFTITDDEGHVRHFSVKRRDKEVLYSPDDVKKILYAIVDIVLDALKHGETISIPRVGTLHIHYREARKVRIPGSRQWKDIPAHYVPKLDPALALRESAKVYEAYKIEDGDPLFTPPPKRGRGRPRKNPLPIPEDMATYDNELAENDCEFADGVEDGGFDDYDDDECVDLELIEDGS